MLRLLDKLPLWRVNAALGWGLFFFTVTIEETKTLMELQEVLYGWKMRIVIMHSLVHSHETNIPVLGP